MIPVDKANKRSEITFHKSTTVGNTIQQQNYANDHFYDESNKHSVLIYKAVSYGHTDW